MKELKEWAIEYARNGLAVFPLREKDKVPATRNGFKDATKDLNQIVEWWNQNPNYNIGIATGAVSGGLVVIDVDQDSEKGKDGIASITEWMKQNGKLNETAEVNTGRGGLHLFYRTNQTFGNRTNLLKNVDVRADGGYVVAPPSIHPNGNPYAWNPNGYGWDFGIHDAGKNVIDLLNYSQNQKQEPFKVEGNEIPDGMRTDTLFKLTCSLIDKGLSETAIRDAVQAENASRCNPPLSEKELEQNVFTAFKRGYQPTHSYQQSSVQSSVQSGDQTQAEAIPDDLSMNSLDEFQTKEIEWVIPGYVPRKQITILAGTGGTGKTSLWCSLISSLSNGQPTIMEGYSPKQIERHPVKCMFFSAEDTVEEVLKKRMEKNRAFMQNIMTISIDDPRFDKVKFANGFLEKLLEKYRPEIVVFDPLQNFIDGSIKMSDRNAMRQQMRKLIEYGSKYETAFLIVMHTNKQSGTWGRTRMSDSADIWDIARSVLMLGEADKDQSLAYVSQEKCNYGKTMQTVIFKNVGGVPVFENYTNDKDRDFVMRDLKNKKDDKNSVNEDIESAENMILSILSENDGKIRSKDADEELKLIGYTSYAIRKAKEALKKANLIKYSKSGMTDWFMEKVK